MALLQKDSYDTTWCPWFDDHNYGAPSILFKLDLD